MSSKNEQDALMQKVVLILHQDMWSDLDSKCERENTRTFLPLLKNSLTQTTVDSKQQFIQYFLSKGFFSAKNCDDFSECFAFINYEFHDQSIGKSTIALLSKHLCDLNKSTLTQYHILARAITSLVVNSYNIQITKNAINELIKISGQDSYTVLSYALKDYLHKFNSVKQCIELFLELCPAIAKDPNVMSWVKVKQCDLLIFFNILHTQYSNDRLPFKTLDLITLASSVNVLNIQLLQTNIQKSDLQAQDSTSLENVLFGIARRRGCHRAKFRKPLKEKYLYETELQSIAAAEALSKFVNTVNIHGLTALDYSQRISFHISCINMCGAVYNPSGRNGAKNTGLFTVNSLVNTLYNKKNKKEDESKRNAERLEAILKFTHNKPEDLFQVLMSQDFKRMPQSIMEQAVKKHQIFFISEIFKRLNKSQIAQVIENRASIRHINLFHCLRHEKHHPILLEVLLVYGKHACPQDMVLWCFKTWPIQYLKMLLKFGVPLTKLKKMLEIYEKQRWDDEEMRLLEEKMQLVLSCPESKICAIQEQITMPKRRSAIVTEMILKLSKRAFAFKENMMNATEKKQFVDVVIKCE